MVDLQCILNKDSQEVSDFSWWRELGSRSGSKKRESLKGYSKKWIS